MHDIFNDLQELDIAEEVLKAVPPKNTPQTLSFGNSFNNIQLDKMLDTKVPNNSAREMRGNKTANTATFGDSLNQTPKPPFIPKNTIQQPSVAGPRGPLGTPFQDNTFNEPSTEKVFTPLNTELQKSREKALKRFSSLVFHSLDTLPVLLEVANLEHFVRFILLITAGIHSINLCAEYLLKFTYKIPLLCTWILLIVNTIWYIYARNVTTVSENIEEATKFINTCEDDYKPKQVSINTSDINLDPLDVNLNLDTQINLDNVIELSNDEADDWELLPKKEKKFSDNSNDMNDVSVGKNFLFESNHDGFNTSNFEDTNLKDFSQFTEFGSSNTIDSELKDLESLPSIDNSEDLDEYSDNIENVKDVSLEDVINLDRFTPQKLDLTDAKSTSLEELLKEPTLEDSYKTIESMNDELTKLLNSLIEV